MPRCMRWSKRLVLLLASSAACAGLVLPARGGEFGVTTGVGYSQTVSSTAWMANSSAPYGRAMNGNSFETSTLTTHNGYQYAAFWRNESGSGSIGVLSVARRQIGGTWQVLDVPDMVSGTGTDNRITNGPNDAHNVVSLGIDRIDGTIHLAYDMHGHTLRYRVSAPGVTTNPGSFTWSTGTATSIFSTAQRNNLNGPAINGVTYPMFINTPTNDLQLAFRVGGSGNGSWWLYNYSGATGAWSNGHQIDDGTVGTYVGTTTASSGTRNNYPNGFTYDSTGALHSTFTWRESATGAANHDLNYVYSQDGGSTWKNNAGAVVGSQGAGTKFNLNSPGLIVRPLAESQTLMNQQGQAVDHEDRFHTIVWHRDSAKDPSLNNVWEPQESSYYQYWRDSLGNWHQNKLNGNVGSRPKIFFDANDNAYAIYGVLSGGGALTGGSGGNLYFSSGDLVIAAASKASNWTDWKIVRTESGPFVTEAQADAELLALNGKLSVIMQASPTLTGNQGTALRTFDYDLAYTAPGSTSLGAASGDWDVSGNWSGSAVPGTNTVVHINGGRTATIDQVVPALDNVLAIGSVGTSGTLNVAAGAALDLLHDGAFSTVYGGSIVVGRDGGAVGAYQQTGGTVSAWRFAVGDYFTESSGGGPSSATISGGTLTTYELDIAFSANGSSSGSIFTINSGTVTVNGDAIIGEFGNTGSLVLQSGKLTVAGDLREGFNKQNVSNFRMDGGTLDMTANTIAVDNFVYNGGVISNVSTTASQSLAGINAGTVLVGTDPALSVATLTVPASTRLRAASRLEIGSRGAFALGSGASALIGNTGSFTASQINITAGGTLAGVGTVSGVVNNAGGSVAPGTSADPTGILLIAGSYSADASSMIDIDLGGMTSTTFDELRIGGAASLAGTLRVSAVDGFVPLPGQSFDVLSFVARSGDVALVNQTGLAGLVLSKSYSATRLTLTAAALHQGDTNLDGQVDITDLGVLATNWQGNANWLGGDFDGSGFVDITDLGILATNWQAGALGSAGDFNAALAGVGLGGASVPEPAMSVAIFALVPLLGYRSRRLC